MSDEPSGWACCWDDPSGQWPFHLAHSRGASHSAFIPPSSANNGCSRLLTASCRLSLARGCARDASHVRSSTPIYGNGTSPTLPRPDASAATTYSAPPNVARMACSDVAWPPLTERMRGAGPRPRSILSQLTFLHGAASLLATTVRCHGGLMARGEDEARCLAAAERDIQAGSHCLSVWSPLARSVRNAKHCCSRPIPGDHHGGGSHDGPTGLPPNEPLGTSSGHCPQGRSCSDPCGETSQDSTHGGPSRAMRVIQRHRPPGPGRHWPAPPRPRCLPGAPGACRALAGSVNWSKSCAWTPPFFQNFLIFSPPFAPFCLLEAERQTRATSAERLSGF